MQNQKLSNFREIVGNPEKSADFGFCAILRTYNPGEGLHRIVKDLESQKDQDFFVLVVDNCSDDETWSKVEAWVMENPSKRSGVRNPCNLGGIGSLFSNLDLIQSPWVIDFHQDDRYEPSHVETIKREVHSTNQVSDLVAVATDMGSISNEGQIIGSPPRAAWFVSTEIHPLWFAATTFRMQVFHMPSAAYKVEALKSVEPPWLNTTFGDSEISIALMSAGSLKIIRRKTMSYRENPASESHIISRGDRLRGLEMGISRVMNQNWFLEETARLKHEEFHRFVGYLTESIELRLGRSQFASSLLSSYMEESLHRRGYDCAAGLEWLQKQYSSTDLTSRIIESAKELTSCHGSFSATNLFLHPQSNGPNKTNDSGAGKVKSYLREAYPLITKLVPHSFLRFIWELTPARVRRFFLGKLWDFDS